MREKPTRAALCVHVAHPFPHGACERAPIRAGARRQRRIHTSLLRCAAVLCGGGKGGGWGGESSSESGEEEDASGYEAYDARFRVLLDNKGLAKPRYKVCVNLLYMHSRVHIPQCSLSLSLCVCVCVFVCVYTLTHSLTLTHSHSHTLTLTPSHTHVT